MARINGTSKRDILKGKGGSDTIKGLAGNDDLFGKAGADILNGGKGNDLLDGGSGPDKMNGGAGNDTYVVDNLGDSISDSSGVDTVKSSISYVLGSRLEKLILRESAAIDGTGNAAANKIKGNGGANRIEGREGNDIQTGGGGNDTFVFDQSSGQDTITDFAAGVGAGDVIEIFVPGVVGNFITAYSDVLDNTVDDGKGNTVITFPSDGSTIKLLNVVKADLAPDDFSFIYGA